jgi:hypothetical protein
MDQMGSFCSSCSSGTSLRSVRLSFIQLLEEIRMPGQAGHSIVVAGEALHSNSVKNLRESSLLHGLTSGKDIQFVTVTRS